MSEPLPYRLPLPPVRSIVATACRTTDGTDTWCRPSSARDTPSVRWWKIRRGLVLRQEPRIVPVNNAPWSRRAWRNGYADISRPVYLTRIRTSRSRVIAQSQTVGHLSDILSDTMYQYRRKAHSSAFSRGFNPGETYGEEFGIYGVRVDHRRQGSGGDGIVRRDQSSNGKAVCESPRNIAHTT